MIDKLTAQYEQAYLSLDPSAQIHGAEVFEQGLFYIAEGKQSGLPFVFEPRLSFRSKEVTVWGAQNGSGKSLLTGQVALQMMRRGQKCLIMSFEMSPERTLYRMLRQSTDHKPTVKDVQPFLASLKGKIFLLNYTGEVKAPIVLGAIVVAARDFGIQQIFIDNLMKVVHGEDDYNAQKEFVQACCDLARLTRVHIHLVHHVRKGQKEDDEIDKFSFKGSSSIIDQVDNAILLQRNRKKEKMRENGDLTPVVDAEEADTVMRIVKQRNGDFEGTVPLWFDPRTTAFCKDAGRKPLWNIEGFD